MKMQFVSCFKREQAVFFVWKTLLIVIDMCYPLVRQ